MVSVCGHLGKYTKPKQTTMLWALVTLIFDKQTCSGQWCSDEKSISSLISQRIWLGIWCHNKNQISSLWTTKKAYQNTHPPLWKSQSLLKSQSKCVKKKSLLIISPPRKSCPLGPPGICFWSNLRKSRCSTELVSRNLADGSTWTAWR